MKKTNRPRLQDVAKLAGVSTMTVSRVLSQDGKVSDAKREVVLKAVEELNYRPNVSARRLASSKSYFIGLLYYDLDGSYVNKFLLRALKCCRATGQHLVADEVDEDKVNSLQSVKELIDITQVDGLILLPPISDDKEVLELVAKSNVPFIRISPDTNLNLSPYISMDDYQAGFEITELLINQGHRKIAHIIGDPAQGVSRLRYQGYLDALRSHQISVPTEYIEQGKFTYESGLSAAKRLLALDDKPTAIFAANDEMAAAVISAAHLNQLAVPEQLSIAGFDDAALATTVSPHLTTIQQPIQKMAELAINILISDKYSEMLKKGPREFRNVLDFDIIERESSAPIK